MGLACCPNPTLPPVASLFDKLKKKEELQLQSRAKGAEQSTQIKGAQSGPLQSEVATI